MKGKIRRIRGREKNRGKENMRLYTRENGKHEETDEERKPGSTYVINMSFERARDEKKKKNIRELSNKKQKLEK